MEQGDFKYLDLGLCYSPTKDYQIWG